MRLAEPISPIHSNRAMANRYRHYERWSARLDGYLALGDAACAFNPVYGQGMSCAAVSARILADCLATHEPTATELPPAFFRAQASFLDDVWNIATGADFRFPETVGPRSPGMWLFNRYVDELFLTAMEDPELLRTVIEVMHLLQPPSALFGPTAAARTALGFVRRLVGGTAEAPVSLMPELLPDASQAA